MVAVPRGQRVEERGFLATLDYYKSEDIVGNMDGFYNEGSKPFGLT